MTKKGKNKILSLLNGEKEMKTCMIPLLQPTSVIVIVIDYENNFKKQEEILQPRQQCDKRNMSPKLEWEWRQHRRIDLPSSLDGKGRASHSEVLSDLQDSVTMTV